MAYVGQNIYFSTIFTDSDSIAADPTTVRFFLRQSVDGTELQWVYNVAPVAGTHYPVGAAALQRDSQGNYSVRWVALKPERHTGFWSGAGNDVDQTSQTTVLVRHSDIAGVEAS